MATGSGRGHTTSGRGHRRRGGSCDDSSRVGEAAAGEGTKRAGVVVGSGKGGSGAGPCEEPGLERFGGTEKGRMVEEGIGNGGD